jgi:hypothetical protein
MFEAIDPMLDVGLMSDSNELEYIPQDMPSIATMFGLGHHADGMSEV